MTVPVAFVIAAKDLRLRFRDRSAIVLGFVAPLAIATLMSFAFQGAAQFHATMGVVDADHGQVAEAFGHVLSSPGLTEVVTIKRFTSEAAASAALRAHSLDAAFVVPAGFTAASVGASPKAISVLTSVDRELAGQVATSVAKSFVAQINADRLSVATALAAGAPADRIPILTAAASSLRLPIEIRNLPSGSRSLEPVSYYAPGMGIFFLFFSIGFTARGYFIEQREGTLERMAAAARPSQILVGKALSVFVYGSASLATMAVFTSVAFGADWGGLIPATLLVLAMVVAVVALTALVIVSARSERQAEGMASIITFALALLGGNFVFISAEPPLLRRLSLFTPNGWALRAFVDLATGPHRIGVVVVPVLAILAFAAAVALVTAALSRRERVVR